MPTSPTIQKKPAIRMQIAVMAFVRIPSKATAIEVNPGMVLFGRHMKTHRETHVTRIDTESYKY